MNRLHLKLYSVIFLSLALLSPAALFAFPAQAIQISDTAAEIRNDFVLEPAKMEVVLEPGETVTRSISVVSRLDKPQTFKLEIEDFVGSRNVNETVKLLGVDTGPYSLKNNINLETRTFTLQPKQRAVVSMQITVPFGAEPGGKYASVLVSTESEGDTGDSGAKTVSRIGSLFFVRVAGKVTESGKLKGIQLANNQTFFEKGPFNLELLYENNGNVHLVPNGNIEIKNFLGRTIRTVEVPPFFSLPDSLRAVQIGWDPGFAFGRYTATVEINRGYKESPDIMDKATVSFWVLPWKILVAILIVFIILVWLLRRITKNFEIKRKQ